MADDYPYNNIIEQAEAITEGSTINLYSEPNLSSMNIGMTILGLIRVFLILIKSQLRLNMS